MEYIFTVIIILLDLICILVFADVILSWLQLFGLRIRPGFIAQIIDPLYKNVKKYIPTSIGPVDFTPIVILLLASFIVGFIEIVYQSIYNVAMIKQGIFFFK